MVLKPEPIFRALEAVRAARGGVTVVLTSPQGTVFDQAMAARLSQVGHLVLLCGRYEGVDERVRARVDEEVSIGDYVLSGGELPALVIVDAIARLVPGVVGDKASVAADSFGRGLLDFPHYTRPAEIVVPRRDGVGVGEDAEVLKVPEVLLSGNHAEIERWRKREAVARTLARRPDLIAEAALDAEEHGILRELVARQKAE
jgi:tRNA (guanine37-N1)-methyltransferase